MPYIARHQESTLTALEIAARNHLIHQGALQKHVIGTTPEHTSALRRISKDYLFPFSRHRVINGFLRKIDLFGRVQRARVALLNDDLERCGRVDREWRWWHTMTELQWMAVNGGGDFYSEVAGYVF